MGLPLFDGMTPTISNVRFTGNAVPLSVMFCPTLQPNFRIVCSPTSAALRIALKRRSAVGSIW
jgi:hypothetical protein